MTLKRWLIAGSETRKTRFHDEKGNRVDFAGAMRAPKSLFSTVVARSIGYRPATPWISYRAVQFLDKELGRDTRAIEFGSGMSTLWLAARCGYLHSIESDAGWYAAVSKRLAGAGNVRYELRTIEQYAEVGDYADESIDFALVDGLWRARCVESVAAKIRRGGYLYLDNTDLYAGQPEYDLPLAEAAALKACEARGGIYKYFVDFRPCQFGVTQGLLVRF